MDEELSIEERLLNWAMPDDDYINAETKEEWFPAEVDAILEFLRDSECLNEKGLELAHNFWKRYIYEEDEGEDFE